MCYANFRLGLMHSQSAATPMETEREAGTLVALTKLANTNFTHTTLDARQDGLRGIVIEDLTIDLVMLALE